eukprot:TRINITY_DN7100_c0_g1_i1.p1 TRINITY_DN7100_c0_g1~~TRINITY_DN7100_c0_g1_i1.p1  ORF type:complete len:599 (-),score=160.24 TRINITY_DN7100_c0_g1_i1:135-1901(-)
MSSRYFRKNQIEELVQEETPEESTTSDDSGPTFANPFSLLSQPQQSTSEEVVTYESSSEDIPAVDTKKKRTPQSEKADQEKADVDIIMEEFGLDESFVASIQSGIKNEGEESIYDIISVDPKFLNKDAEMRRLFGSVATGGRKRRNMSKNRQRKIKKTKMTTFRDNWPPTENLLTMELVESHDGDNYFRIVWSHDYHEVQNNFYSCVDTGDPRNLSNLLHFHPYHIDTMLQLSDACQHTGELDLSIEFIERILYRLETLWHPLFNPYKYTNCRLEYQYQENRSFFLAIFKHIVMVGRSGCSRTALEFSKLLLSFDLSDPVGVLLLIDTYCIRSKQYEYLFDLVSSSLFDTNNFPNMAFSIALAKFHMEKKAKKAGDEIDDGTLSSDVLLRNALIMYPSVLGGLCQNISVRSIRYKDAEGNRTDCLMHPYFLEPASTNLQRLITLYIERNNALWKDPKCVDWLKRIAGDALDLVLTSDPIVEELTIPVLETYSEDTDKFYTHILLSDNSEVLQTLPVELVRDGLQVYDNLPPPRRADHNAGGNEVYNGVRMFIESLMPWIDPEQGADLQWLNNVYDMMGFEGENEGENE